MTNGLIFDEPLNNRDEIVPNLWMGAWPAYDVKLEYDMIVCVSDNRPNYTVLKNKTVLVWFPFEDSEYQKPDTEKLEQVVKMVVDSVQSGKSTLVHCTAGINRSGLIAAMSLVRMGYDTDKAIALLREKRGEVVLYNDLFERIVGEMT
jgi:protein tyrosine phosphatase